MIYCPFAYTVFTAGQCIEFLLPYGFVDWQFSCCKNYFHVSYGNFHISDHFSEKNSDETAILEPLLWAKGWNVSLNIFFSVFVFLHKLQHVANAYISAYDMNWTEHSFNDRKINAISSFRKVTSNLRSTPTEKKSTVKP